ncbi:MAG: hypothetical protein LBK53_05335 [Heliobacteriaceae bacterium]|jgi:tetratricopeptide (TPR) repeat protein|nr:hypothetical protein [Heliobacteriaceae bacterium]
MIYKIKIQALFFALLIFVSFTAAQGSVMYDDYFLDFSAIDTSKIEREADDYFTKAAESASPEERGKYIDIAQSRYYILSQIDMQQIKYAVQLARIYDYKKKDRLAKEYFYRAMNLNAYDAHANYYFGEFYFSRKDYKRALARYIIAHNNGLRNKYELNYNMAVIYEKLGDLANAVKYYSACLAANPPSEEVRAELKQKIDSINELNYNKSEYYYNIRE